MYEQYQARCKNFSCNAYLGFPSEQTYAEESGDRLILESSEEDSWPPEEWKTGIACPRCGNIREYTEKDVRSFFTHERLPQPRCLRVDMGCAKLDCKLAFHFYLLPLMGRMWCQETADDIDITGDVITLLREGRFTGKCPSGHQLDRLPRPLYRITEHVGLIPSQHSDLHWVRHSSRAAISSVLKRHAS
jgi:hypothetical protein